MQVLISYALVPEDHVYYLVDLEGEELEIVLASQNMYTNCDTWPQEEAFQNLLERLDVDGKRHAVTGEPIEITGDVTVVHAGFIL